MSVKSELLSGGPMETWGHFDTDSGDLTVEYKQDIEDLLDHNKALYNLNDGYSPSREWRRAASIPYVVLEIWRGMGIDYNDPNDAPLVRRQLNDIDWSKLRTAPGRL